jgi:hypothetical protein
MISPFVPFVSFVSFVVQSRFLVTSLRPLVRGLWLLKARLA